MDGLIDEFGDYFLGQGNTERYIASGRNPAALPDWGREWVNLEWQSLSAVPPKGPKIHFDPVSSVSDDPTLQSLRNDVGTPHSPSTSFDTFLQARVATPQPPAVTVLAPTSSPSISFDVFLQTKVSTSQLQTPSEPHVQHTTHMPAAPNAPRVRGGGVFGTLVNLGIGAGVGTVGALMSDNANAGNVLEAAAVGAASNAAPFAGAAVALSQGDLLEAQIQAEVEALALAGCAIGAPVGGVGGSIIGGAPTLGVGAPAGGAGGAAAGCAIGSTVMGVIGDEVVRLDALMRGLDVKQLGPITQTAIDAGKGVGNLAVAAADTLDDMHLSMHLQNRGLPSEVVLLRRMIRESTPQQRQVLGLEYAEASYNSDALVSQKDIETLAVYLAATGIPEAKRLDRNGDGKTEGFELTNHIVAQDKAKKLAVQENMRGEPDSGLNGSFAQSIARSVGPA